MADQPALLGRGGPRRFPALTILQPCGTAIAAEVKPWENRPRPPSEKQLRPGDWLGLHVGVRAWDGADMVRELWPACPRDVDLPWGALLGAWRFGGAFHVDRVKRIADQGQDPHPAFLSAGMVWAFGPSCWRVDAVRLFDQPIPCVGHQGVWYLPDELAERSWRLVA